MASAQEVEQQVQRDHGLLVLDGPLGSLSEQVNYLASLGHDFLRMGHIVASNSGLVWKHLRERIASLPPTSWPRSLCRLYEAL